MRFDLLDMISAHGVAGRANDDRVGTTARRAWVVDGATDLGPPGLVGPQGGAAWLADAAATAFAASDKADLRSVCTEVFATIARRFETDQARPVAGAWDYPKAAFAAAQLAGDRMQVAWSADCTILQRSDDRPHWCTPEPDTRGEAAAARALGVEAWKMQGDALADRRAHRGRPDHQGIGVDPLASAAATSHAEVAVSAGDYILVMSDGMSCLISDYAAYDAAGLFAAAERIGLGGLFQEIRQIENADPDCARYPRFKKSDDASAILLRVV